MLAHHRSNCVFMGQGATGVITSRQAGSEESGELSPEKATPPTHESPPQFQGDLASPWGA